MFEAGLLVKAGKGPRFPPRLGVPLMVPLVAMIVGRGVCYYALLYKSKGFRCRAAKRDLLIDCSFMQRKFGEFGMNGKRNRNRNRNKFGFLSFKF